MSHTPNTSWYEVRNATPTTGGEMVLYGFIGPYDSIDDKAFIRDFAALAGKSKSITLRLNSGGGSVFAGIPIYNAIKNSPVPVSIVVEGMAASMASVLLQAATPGQRKMYKNARVMVHKPSGGAAGSASKMRQTADLLDSMETTLADIYEENTGQSAATVKSWLVEGVDKWFTAKEAVAAGIIDEIIDAVPTPVAAPKASLSEADMFAHYQAALEADPPTTPTEPDDTTSLQPPNPLMNFGIINSAAAAAGVTATLTAQSTEQDVVNVINSLAAAKDAEIKRLTDRLTASNEEKVTALVNEAVSSGKIVAGQRDSFEKLARADFANTAVILGGMAGKPSATNLVQLEAVAGGQQVAEGVDPRAGWDFGKYRKEAPAALAKMQREDPKLYEALKEKHTKTLNSK